jgi:hypothetical protein
MAVIFNRYLQNLMIGSGILGGIYSASYYAITVYGGVQPSASTILSSWSSTYYNTYLAHWSSVPLIQPNSSIAGDGRQLTLSTATSSVTANASGTAAWAIMWPNNPVTLTTTLPSTQFIIVPAGIRTTTKNVVQFTDPTFVGGISGYSITAFALTATGGVA